MGGRKSERRQAAEREEKIRGERSRERGERERDREEKWSTVYPRTCIIYRGGLDSGSTNYLVTT